MSNLFENITISNKQKLLKMLEARTSIYNDSVNILSNYLEPNYIGIVESGTVQIVQYDYNGNRTLIEELYKNDVFGSMLSTTQNSEFALFSKGETVITFIDYDRISSSELTRQEFYVQFMKNFIHILNERIIERNERIEVLVKKTIRDKLLAYFNIMAKKRASSQFKIPFSYTDLADYLAIDRCAMYREIKNLKEDKLISINKRQISIMYEL